MLNVRPKFIATAAAIAFGSVAIVGVILDLLAPTPDPNELRRYAADDRKLEMAKTRPNVVFIGDSVTDKWTIVAPETWDPSWVNRGIGGQRSREIRARFAQDVLALHPKVVHIQAGINDIGGLHGLLPLNQTEANIDAMASHARVAGIRVVIGTVERIPQGAWKAGPGAEGQIEALNSWIRAYSARTHASVADYWAVMAPDLTLDGVHPTRAGYAVMARIAHQALTS